MTDYEIVGTGYCRNGSPLPPSRERYREIVADLLANLTDADLSSASMSGSPKDNTLRIRVRVDAFDRPEAMAFCEPRIRGAGEKAGLAGDWLENLAISSANVTLKPPEVRSA